MGKSESLGTTALRPREVRAAGARASHSTATISGTTMILEKICISLGILSSTFLEKTPELCSCRQHAAPYKKQDEHYPTSIMTAEETNLKSSPDVPLR